MVLYSRVSRLLAARVAMIEVYSRGWEDATGGGDGWRGWIGYSEVGVFGLGRW